MFKDQSPIPTGVDHKWARLRHWETLLSKDPNSWDFHLPLLFTNHSLEATLKRWMKPDIGYKFIAERHALDDEDQNTKLEFICHINNPPLTPGKTRFMGRYLHLREIFDDSVKISQSNNKYKSQKIKVDLLKTDPALPRIYLPNQEGFFQTQSACVTPLFYLDPNTNQIVGENRKYVLFSLGLTNVV